MKKRQHPLQPDRQWIQARIRLLRQIKNEVLTKLGPEPADVRRYSAIYEKEFSRRWVASSKAELMSEIERHDVIYGGDFHAFTQAQRTHLKILRSLSDERPVILGLECFSVKAQKWLDRFSRGEITLDELREKSLWEDEWGFPWDGYRGLLELAKRKGHRLIALNTPGHGHRSAAQLRRREGAAAVILKEAMRKKPNAMAYVIFGDLHLAESHLPKALQDLFPKRPVRDLIIHLNSEKIYFQLARRGLEQTVDVVKLKRNQFCVLSSPPWVKWQSYLLFLERSLDPYLDDDTGFISAEEEFDPTDHVARFVRLAESDLHLNFKMDDLSIYTSTDERAAQALAKFLRPMDRVIGRSLVASGRSVLIAASGVGILTGATVNHAASMAGLYMHARMSGLHRQLWRMPNDLSGLIWSEAAAFFISKLINHKRQAESLIDLRSRLAVSGPNDLGSEAMRIALDHGLSELVWLRQGRRRKLQFRPRRKTSYLEAARILGGMMGERLYLAYRSRRFTENRIVAMLKRDVTMHDFAREYEDIVLEIARSETGGVAGTFAGLPSKKERL